MQSDQDPRSDADLLRSTASDPDAFGVFYRRHARLVLRYLAVRCPSPETAADLMAETFASALLHAADFEPGPAPVEAWLYTIASRKLQDAWRRGRVADAARRRLELEPLTVTDDELDRVERQADLDRRDPPVLDVLESLPAELRTAVQGRVLDELSYRELADRLACSESLARQRVSRGLRRIRTTIAKTTDAVEEAS